LSPINPEHRAYLEQQMEIFLFGEGGDEPQGWLPPVSG
jgi:Fe-S cluster biosynthesis and repair protein YggX